MVSKRGQLDRLGGGLPGERDDPIGREVDTCGPSGRWPDRGRGGDTTRPWLGPWLRWPIGRPSGGTPGFHSPTSRSSRRWRSQWRACFSDLWGNSPAMALLSTRRFMIPPRLHWPRSRFSARGPGWPASPRGARDNGARRRRSVINADRSDLPVNRPSWTKRWSPTSARVPWTTTRTTDQRTICEEIRAHKLPILPRIYTVRSDLASAPTRIWVTDDQKILSGIDIKSFPKLFFVAFLGSREDVLPEWSLRTKAGGTEHVPIVMRRNERTSLVRRSYDVVCQSMLN